MDARLLDNNVVEPDDVPFAVGDFCAFVLVGLEVSMSNGRPMIGVRFMDVFRRNQS